MRRQRWQPRCGLPHEMDTPEILPDGPKSSQNQGVGA
jgi:hypothetical protein